MFFPQNTSQALDIWLGGLGTMEGANWKDDFDFFFPS